MIYTFTRVFKMKSNKILKCIIKYIFVNYYNFGLKANDREYLMMHEYLWLIML